MCLMSIARWCFVPRRELSSTKTVSQTVYDPGITGWAQCHGRNAISWGEKFKLDVWYVDHCSFKTDLNIVFTTIKKVVMRSDITHEGSATMEAFNGNN